MGEGISAKQYFVIVQIESDLLDLVLGLDSSSDELINGLVKESNEIKHILDRKNRQLPLLQLHTKLFNRLMELYSPKYELEYDKLIEKYG